MIAANSTMRVRLPGEALNRAGSRTSVNKRLPSRRSPFEAASAQPGEMWAYAIKAWFWDQTVAGETLFAAYRAGLEHPDKAWSGNPRSLVPGDLRSQGAGGVVALSAGHRGGDHIRRSGRSP